MAFLGAAEAETTQSQDAEDSEPFDMAAGDNAAARQPPPSKEPKTADWYLDRCLLVLDRCLMLINEMGSEAEGQESCEDGIGGESENERHELAERRYNVQCVQLGSKRVIFDEADEEPRFVTISPLDVMEANQRMMQQYVGMAGGARANGIRRPIN